MMTMSRLVFQLVKIKIVGGVTSVINFMRGREAKGKGFNIGTAMIIAVILIAFLMMMGFSFFMALALGYQMFTKHCLWIYFPMGIICSSVFALLGTIFAAKSYLFDATDNNLLLSMPIKPHAILISRMMALYLLNLFYSSMIFVPVAIAYGIFFHYNALSFINCILAMLIAPLFVTAIASIFGYLIGLISYKIRHTNFLAVTFGILMLFVLTIIGLNIVNIFQLLMEKIDVLAAWLRNISTVMYWFGMAMIDHKNRFGNIPAYISIWGTLPFYLICAAVTYIIYRFISSKFIKTITRKIPRKKKVYIEKPMKPTNIQITLIKKEVGYFLSIPGYVMNAALGAIMNFMLGIGILLRGHMINEWLPKMFPDASSNLIALAVGSSVALCCAINDVTAPSISLEGKTIWLLKSTPVKPMKIFIAKALLAPIVSLPGVLFTAITCAITLDLNFEDVIFIFFIPLLACVFSGFLGVCVNLKIPRFDWTTEITVIKQSMSVIFTLFLSMFFTAVPFVVAIIPAAFLERFSSIWAYGICIIYFFLLVVLEIFYLYTDGSKIWEEL